MELAIITPIPLLHKYATKSKYHMALAHLVLESMGYAAFYGKRSQLGEYVILDNSIIELGDAVDVATLVKAAGHVGASEIILPDVYQDCNGTLKLIEHAIRYDYDKLKDYKLMAVPQGKTQQDWLYCYQTICREFPQIEVIGIPKSTSEFMSDNSGRVNLVQHMYTHGLVKYDKEYHLLGCHNNPIEIRQMAVHRWIRGVDTCVPVLYGQLGINFHRDKGVLIDRPANKPDFYSKDDDFPGLINHNIKCMIEWGSNHDS